MSKENLRIGIIGAGAIGSLFGGYLAGVKSNRYSIDVVFFCRKAHAEVINQKGLKIFIDRDVKEIRGIKAFKDEKFFEKQIEKDSSFGFDFLFLTTKAYDIKSVVVQYNKLIEKSRWLIILQNGIGNEDIVIQHCPKSKIIRALTTNGAILNAPGELIHTGFGLTKMGFPFLGDLEIKARQDSKSNIRISFLRDLLNKAGLETVIVEDIVKECWEKVFINIGINAIGALTRLSNGKLLKLDKVKMGNYKWRILIFVYFLLMYLAKNIENGYSLF